MLALSTLENKHINNNEAATTPPAATTAAKLSVGNFQLGWTSSLMCDVLPVKISVFS